MNSKQSLELLIRGSIAWYKNSLLHIFAPLETYLGDSKVSIDYEIVSEHWATFSPELIRESLPELFYKLKNRLLRLDERYEDVFNGNDELIKLIVKKYERLKEFKTNEIATLIYKWIEDGKTAKQFFELEDLRLEQQRINKEIRRKKHE